MNKLTTKPKTWQIILVLIIGIIGISTAAIFIRLCQEITGLKDIEFSLFIAASRLIIASLFLSPTYPNLFKTKISPSGLFYAISAGICLGFHFATWISSLAFTSVVASTTIVTTNPLWVIIISWLWWGEKPSNKTIFGIFIALMGGVIIAFGDYGINSGNNPLLGNFLALLGSWGSSGYLLLGKQAQNQGLSVSNYIAIAYLSGAICLFPLPFLVGSGYFGCRFLVYFYIILMAIFSQLIGHTSLNWGMRWISPTIIALLVLFEPIGSSILAFLLFGEIPSILVLIGAFCLLIGVIITTSRVGKF
jgi:drug/metabolite transporter (DMT)-like permease